jgi:hypothetical protein
LTNESGKKAIKIADADVKQFLRNPAKENIAKGDYDRGKDQKYKGKTYDQAKDSIVRDILAGEKVEEIRKINDSVAAQVAGVLTADKSSDAKVNALLKPYDATVRATGMVSRMNTFIPGIGDSKDLLADLFAAKSPIDPAQGGKAKKYNTATGVLVAIVSETQRPDASKFDAQKPELMRGLANQKERELFDAWIKKLQSKAKIDRNPSVVSDGGPDEG